MAASKPEAESLRAETQCEHTSQNSQVVGITDPAGRMAKAERIIIVKPLNGELVNTPEKVTLCKGSTSRHPGKKTKHMQPEVQQKSSPQIGIVDLLVSLTS